MKEKIREILWNFVAGEVTDSEAVQQVLDLFAVMPSLPIERFDAEDWLSENKDIWNHPRITDRTDKESKKLN